jgi:murein DD-endopeptidase MepM/ murein hydrolase activator NlpD
LLVRAWVSPRLIVVIAVLLGLIVSTAPAERVGANAGASLHQAPPTGMDFTPAFFRPVIVDGKAFPLARSNFLSLLTVHSNWHAPRLRFVGGQWKLIGIHEGIDITAEQGTPVVSMTAGVVENAGWTFYSGTRVGVRGADGRYYLYAHLSDVAGGVAPGSVVDAGTLLGLVGNTGYGPPGHQDEFPPHLHLGVLAGSEWVNPYPTLVDLYEATVRVTDRGQAALDELAAAGKRRAWEREAALLYMSIAPSGE